MLELYSAFMVGNIQDFENGKCLRSWRMVLSCLKASLIFLLGKTRLQIHCYHNFSPDFTNVEAGKITTEFIAGRTSGPMRPTKRSEDFVDDLPVSFKLTTTI